ncbi:hypothetical protein BS78_05G071200 [Paspalum vaginatum]|nr:hypothetical protein BS78_05G071200 [Paspalum vaginatum]
MAPYYAIALLLGMLAVFFSGGTTVDDTTLQITLYMKQTPAQDQISLAQGTVLINWPIKDGTGASANTTGHAKGLTTQENGQDSTWVIMMNLVFDNGSHAGSSLQVMGQHGASGQWSVMGGTGNLTMARGIIKYNTLYQDADSRTIEMQIYAYCTPMESILAL